MTHLRPFNPPVVLESRKEGKEGGRRKEGERKRGRKERRTEERRKDGREDEEGRKERKKEGTAKTDGVNLTREDDRKVKEKSNNLYYQ